MFMPKNIIFYELFEEVGKTVYNMALMLKQMVYEPDKKQRQLVFQPLPNFIFTRDIGIVLNDHLLLSNAATPAR